MSNATLSQAGGRKRQTDDHIAESPSKEARKLKPVNIAGLIEENRNKEKPELDRVLEVRVLKHTFQRGKRGLRKRYIHLNVADTTGHMLVKAFDARAEKINKQLEGSGPWCLELSGVLQVKDPARGFEHYCPDGALYISDDTDHKVTKKLVECLDPQDITLSRVEELPAYKSRVSLKAVLVVKKRFRQNAYGEKILEMVLFDGTTEKCVLLSSQMSELQEPLFYISIKEAWIYPNGNQKMLRCKKEDIDVVDEEVVGPEMKEKWSRMKSYTDVLGIPYTPVKMVSDIIRGVKEGKAGTSHFFKVYAVIKTVMWNEKADPETQDFAYRACPQDHCQKKVEKIHGAFHCPKCCEAVRRPQWRYKLKLMLGDCEKTEDQEDRLNEMLEDLDIGFDELNDADIEEPACDEEDQNNDEAGQEEDEEVIVTAFDEGAKNLLERKCPDLVDYLKERNGHTKVTKELTRLLDTKWELGIRAKKNVNSEFVDIVIQEMFGLYEF